MKKIITIIFSVLLIISASFYSFASLNDYKTETVDEKKKNEIWENLNIQVESDFNIQEERSAIISFDVSKDENVVLGLENNTLLLLDKNGDIIRKINFDLDSFFYVAWEGENILLYISRGFIIVEMTPKGELVDMVVVENKILENTILWRETTRRESIIVNDNTYQMKNDMGIFNAFVSSNSRLVKIDSNGITTTIYDVNSQQLIGIFVETLLALLFITVIVIFIVYQIKEDKRRNQKKSG